MTRFVDLAPVLVFGAFAACAQPRGEPAPAPGLLHETERAPETPRPGDRALPEAPPSPVEPAPVDDVGPRPEDRPAAHVPPRPARPVPDPPPATTWDGGVPPTNDRTGAPPSPY